MIRGPLNKPWVFNLGVFWSTKDAVGQFQLQQHDDSERIWDYKFRVVETRKSLPPRLVATSNTPEEIAADWKHFTGREWRP